MRNKFANAVMEYVILIGTISLVFITMNMYIKRGLQSRVADMTDYFIGREQAPDSNPTAQTTANSSTVSTSDVATDLYRGGGMRLAFLDSTNTEAYSNVIDDPTQPRAQSFIPADRGNITLPERPTEEDIKEVYDTEAESIKAQIRRLEIQRDNLLLEAKILEEKAKIIDQKGRELIRRANRMDCEGSHSCRRARSRMKSAGQQMVKDAAALMREAAQKRAEAQRLQITIDALKKQL
jgi:hypothetical protein